jgi:hypothetical protein
VVYIRTILRHRTGAKLRAAPDRSKGAARGFIKAEVPKDTGPITYLASSAQRLQGIAST